MDSRKTHLRTLRSVVLAAGSLLALFFLLAFFPKIVSVFLGTAQELPTGRHWEGRVMIAMVLTFMAGYAIGWWRPFWGGLLMIIAALLVSGPFILQGNYGSLIFGIPQFAIGVLYILLSRLEKRKSIENGQRHSV